MADDSGGMVWRRRRAWACTGKRVVARDAARAADRRRLLFEQRVVALPAAGDVAHAVSAADRLRAPGVSAFIRDFLLASGLDQRILLLLLPLLEQSVVAVTPLVAVAAGRDAAILPACNDAHRRKTDDVEDGRRILTSRCDRVCRLCVGHTRHCCRPLCLVCGCVAKVSVDDTRCGEPRTTHHTLTRKT